MKTIFMSVMVLGIAGLVGCDGKSTPGGPGATKTDASGRVTTKSTVGTADNAFRLDPPNLETNIKQGEIKSITIGIDRGKNFDQDVKVEFGEMPKGLKFTPANPTLKAGDKDVKISVEAAKDAALGNHTVNVTGTPAKEGAKANTTLKFEVKKAD
jgi:hypothetical protein